MNTQFFSTRSKISDRNIPTSLSVITSSKEITFILISIIRWTRFWVRYASISIWSAGWKVSLTSQISSISRNICALSYSTRCIIICRSYIGTFGIFITLTLCLCTFKRWTRIIRLYTTIPICYTSFNEFITLFISCMFIIRSMITFYINTNWLI